MIDVDTSTAVRYKTCTRCGESKVEEDFYFIGPHRPGKRAAQCKACVIQNQQRPERRETRLAANRAWRAAHPDRQLAASRRWKQANKNRVASGHHRRWAHLHGVRSSVTGQQWEFLVALFGRRCVYCCEAKPLTREHIVPLSQGGTDTLDNVVPACRSCNSRKQTKTLLIFLLSRSNR